MKASLAVFDMRVDHAKLKLFHFYYNPTPTPNMRDAPSKQQVDQNTFEWNNVAYKIQSMTGKSSLKIVKLFKYPKKTQHQKYNSKEKLDSLIDVTDYKSQYKNKIINQVIPLEDVLFFCGHVDLKKYHQEPNKIFNFLMCKVMLGKIGKLNEAGSQVDSLFIPSEHQAEPYHFNFLLNQHSQYEVKYEISYVIGDEHENKIKQAICSICERNIATIYCRDELMHFCDSCCDSHHNQIKLAHEDEYRKRLTSNRSNFEPNKSAYNLSNASNTSNRKQNASAALLTVPPIPPHQLQKLSLIHTLPLCQNHSIKNEYYCLKCQKYVCNICIQKGTHNQNPEHVIKHIEYLYSEKSQANNTISTRLKQKLQHLLENIESISNSVTENYQHIKRKLTKQFQEALSKLDELYLQKISLVYSDQIQLNMIYQKLEWEKAFILHQEKQLKPINYFKLQSRYESQINSLRISGYDESFNIKPDLDCFIQCKVGYKNEVLLEKTKKPNDTDANTYTAFVPQVDKKYPPSSAIFQFDSKSQAPKKGDLSLLLQKGNFHIFKFKPLGHQTQ